MSDPRLRGEEGGQDRAVQQEEQEETDTSLDIHVLSLSRYIFLLSLRLSFIFFLHTSSLSFFSSFFYLTQTQCLQYIKCMKPKAQT